MTGNTTEAPPSTARPRPVVIHVTTVPMSLRYLLLNQLLAIREAGFDVMGMSATGPDTEALETEEIRHLSVALNRSLFTPLRDLRATWQMFRAFRRETPMIVHTHTPKPGFWGQIAARLAGVPVVVNTIHGFYFHEGTSPYLRRALIFMEWIAARCSHAILSQNPEDIDTAVRSGICAREDIELLGNGIDVRRFAREKLPADEPDAIRAELDLEPHQPVVGFVGRLVEEKGLLELIEAARTLRATHPDVRYLFVGATDTHKPDAFDPDTMDPEIRRICRFAGHRDDMARLYAAMDIFCLPSRREGFPRAPMEAAAMGVPSVLTDIRGCRQVVVPEETGLLVPVRSSDALASALRRLVEDETLRQRMGRAAYDRAAIEFDERRVFDRVLATYARLLDRSSARAQLHTES